jgi:hypothetical protein
LGSTIKFHACALARLGDWMRSPRGGSRLAARSYWGMAIAGAKLGGLQGLVLGWTLAVERVGAALVFGWTFGLRSASDPLVVARRPNVKEFSPPRGHRGIGSETDRTGGPPNSVLFDVDSRNIGSFRFHLEHPACE